MVHRSELVSNEHKIKLMGPVTWLILWSSSGMTLRELRKNIAF